LLDDPGMLTAMHVLDSNSESTLKASGDIAKLFSSLKLFTGLDRSDFQFANINEALLATLDVLRPRIKGQIKINTQLDEIPLVKIRSKEMNQVFMILMLNAVEAITGKGSINIRSKVKNKNRVEITIRDTGRGMNKEQLKDLFEMGFHSKDGKVKMNMNIWSARNIVQEQGGDIRVRSIQGKGTTFTISLLLEGM